MIWLQQNRVKSDLRADRVLVWGWGRRQRIDPVKPGQAARFRALLSIMHPVPGTLLGEQHVDLHVIQRILGHAQVSTTRIYTYLTDPPTREAVGRIGSELWPDAPDAAQPQLRMQRPTADGTGEEGKHQVITGEVFTFGKDLRGWAAAEGAPTG
jgi:hypothetical protein